ncbi:hypothetical protein ACOME3_001683 [Neoechinorhynchus agilis]
MFNDDTSGTSDDEDNEVREAFRVGRLKPGLNIEVPFAAQRKSINNKAGLKAKLKQLQAENLPWIERVDVTVEVDDDVEANPESSTNHTEIFNDDFKLEAQIQKLASVATMAAIDKFKKLHIPYKRPVDYYAEMLKSDDHMKKIKSKLIGKQEEIERREHARRLRHQRKFGKKIQIQAELKKSKQKREFKSAIEKRSKGANVEKLIGKQKPKNTQMNRKRIKRRRKH